MEGARISCLFGIDPLFRPTIHLVQPVTICIQAAVLVKCHDRLKRVPPRSHRFQYFTFHYENLFIAILPFLATASRQIERCPGPTDGLMGSVSEATSRGAVSAALSRQQRASVASVAIAANCGAARIRETAVPGSLGS